MNERPKRSPVPLKYVKTKILAFLDKFDPETTEIVSFKIKVQTDKITTSIEGPLFGKDGS